MVALAIEAEKAAYKGTGRTYTPSSKYCGVNAANQKDPGRTRKEQKYQTRKDD